MLQTLATKEDDHWNTDDQDFYTSEYRRQFTYYVVKPEILEKEQHPDKHESTTQTTETATGVR